MCKSRPAPLPGTDRAKRRRHVGLPHPARLEVGTAEQRGAGVRDAEITIVGGGAVGCAVAYVLSGAGQLALLNDLDIGMTGPGQDVRDRAPDCPAADDRDLSVPDASAALLRRAHLLASRAG